MGGGESSPSSSSSMLDFRLRRFMEEGSGEEDSEGEARQFSPFMFCWSWEWVGGGMAILRSLDSSCGVRLVYRCCGLDQDRGVLYRFSRDKERSRGGVMSEEPLGVWNNGSSFTSPKVTESSMFCCWLIDEMPPWSSNAFIDMDGEVGSSLKSG